MVFNILILPNVQVHPPGERAAGQLLQPAHLRPPLYGADGGASPLFSKRFTHGQELDTTTGTSGVEYASKSSSYPVGNDNACK